MLKGILWKILAGALAVVTFIAWLLSARTEKLQEQRDTARQKAKGERQAREHLQETRETTREVEDDIRQSGPDDRRERLRKYASGSRDSQ